MHDYLHAIGAIHGLSGVLIRDVYNPYYGRRRMLYGQK